MTLIACLLVVRDFTLVAYVERAATKSTRLTKFSSMAPSLLGWLDDACEQPVELLPLGLGELSEELQGVGVDRPLGEDVRCVYLPGVVAVRLEHVFNITGDGAVRLTDHGALVDLGPRSPGATITDPRRAIDSCLGAACFGLLRRFEVKPGQPVAAMRPFRRRIFAPAGTRTRHSRISPSDALIGNMGRDLPT
jgi:hypothetical protein